MNVKIKLEFKKIFQFNVLGTFTNVFERSYERFFRDFLNLPGTYINFERSKKNKRSKQFKNVQERTNVEEMNDQYSI
jgi:hypothetical protein